MAYQSLSSSDVTATCYKKSYSATSFSLSGTENFTFLNSNTRLSIGDDSSNYYIYVTKITFSLPSAATGIKLQLLKGTYSGSGGISVYHSTTNYTQNNMLGTNGLISKNDQNGHSLNYTASGTLNIPTSSGQYYSACDVFTLSKSFSAGTNYLYLYSFSIYAPLYGGTTTDGTAISSYLSYNPTSGGGDSGGGDSGGGDSGGSQDEQHDEDTSAKIKSNEFITATGLNALKTKIKTMYSNRPLITSTQKGYAGTALNNNYFQQYDMTEIEQIGDLINACLVINDIPNLKFVDLVNSSNSYVNRGENIFGDGTTTDLMTWLSNAKRDATGTSTDHGCRGACVGICSGGCSGTGSGTTNQKGNDYTSPGGSLCGGCTSCTNACEGDCGNGCNNACQLQSSGVGQMHCTGCVTECAANCSTYCSGYCQKGCSPCSGSCTGVCASDCGGGCKTNCGNGCYQTCTDNCDDTCKDQCAINCAIGCYGTATGTCYGCSSQCVSQENAHTST